jgi:hypothetical protein
MLGVRGIDSTSTCTRATSSTLLCGRAWACASASVRVRCFDTPVSSLLLRVRLESRYSYANTPCVLMISQLIRVYCVLLLQPSSSVCPIFVLQRQIHVFIRGCVDADCIDIDLGFRVI